MKTCKKCGVVQPETEYGIPNKKIGLVSRRCKTCMREEKRKQMANWRANNPEKVLAGSRRREAQPSTKATRRAYKANNKETIKVKAAEYRLKNKDKINASSARYREENKDILRERQRQWRIANPQDYTAIHSRWKSANKALVNAATHRRRARIKGCSEHHTAQEWEDLKRACDYTCLCCGQQEPGSDYLALALAGLLIFPVFCQGNVFAARLELRWCIACTFLHQSVYVLWTIRQNAFSHTLPIVFRKCTQIDRAINATRSG
jgi:hypothetical protein